MRIAIFILIGGLIGWITNKIAIKMLFRPINPHKILGMNFQGVFPRRKDQIAKSLADIIEQELLSKEDLMNQMLSKDKIEQIKEKLTVVMVNKLSEAIPPAISMFMGGDVKSFIEKYINKHGDHIFEEMLDEFKNASLENIDIYHMVKTRIDELDFIEFEKIIFGLMNKELRFIEVIGLFLGGFIGAIQYLITMFL
ncbi:DUF445 family protein [Mycoplasmatota bacterium]|nr:DUF445 family protein [Mycoplasmatota bacterium]